MDNWGAVIYTYERGSITREAAMKITRQRLKQVHRGSIAYKRLRAFLVDLEKGRR